MRKEREEKDFRPRNGWTRGPPTLPHLTPFLRRSGVDLGQDVGSGPGLRSGAGGVVGQRWSVIGH